MIKDKNLQKEAFELDEALRKENKEGAPKFDYYTPPSQEVFEEVKRAAISVWKNYDDTYGYATEKINMIKDIKNIRDNTWYMVAMFDVFNQAKLFDLVNLETAALIRRALRGY